MEILDIGSGPVSMLTNAFHGLRASLKAADPLADEYDPLWTDSVRKAQVVRPPPWPEKTWCDAMATGASMWATFVTPSITHAIRLPCLNR